MSKLLSKVFYGNHYYLNIDSKIGSVSRLAANPWQYHQPSSSSKSTSSCSATCQTASAQPSTSMIIYQNQGNMRKFRIKT